MPMGAMNILANQNKTVYNPVVFFNIDATWFPSALRIRKAMLANRRR